eukprot:scaffold690_cov76-Skeletonema_dohrnii-CCMP3373.AAC.9
MSALLANYSEVMMTSSSARFEFSSLHKTPVEHEMHLKYTSLLVRFSAVFSSYSSHRPNHS